MGLEGIGGHDRQPPVYAGRRTREKTRRVRRALSGPTSAKNPILLTVSTTASSTSPLNGRKTTALYLPRGAARGAVLGAGASAQKSRGSGGGGGGQV